MWFKVYYPLEFYVILFSNSPKDKFSSYFAEAMNKGIKVVAANINKSKSGFTISDENTIMFGISHIMSVGPAIVDIILRARGDKDFESFDDFWNRTAEIKKVSKNSMLALINAHAFDCFDTQNQILEKYFRVMRKEKDWYRDVDYEDKKFEHDKFVDAYSLDWRTKLSESHKKSIKSLGAKSLAKLVSPRANLRRFVWGVVNEIIHKTSKNGNSYYYVILVDSKFNVAKVRLPIYNRRCKKMKVHDKATGTFKSVKIDDDSLQVGNIIAGQAESSEYHGKIYVDLVDICCIGNVYEKTDEQRNRLKKYEDLYNGE